MKILVVFSLLLLGMVLPGNVMALDSPVKAISPGAIALWISLNPIFLSRRTGMP